MKKLMILVLLILFFGAVNAKELKALDSDVMEINTILGINNETAADCGGAVQCNCEDRLVEDQVLWYDLTGCSYGIRINDSNITLDCNGHTIEGDYTGGEGYGIFFAGKQGVTVKNCIIKGFFTGVYSYSNNYSEFSDNSVSDNQNLGIWLNHSNNNNLFNNTTHNNEEIGFFLDDSNNNTISENTSYDEIETGISLEDSFGNELTGNNINNIGGIFYQYGVAILLKGSNNNIISDNNLSNNGYSGLSLFESSNNQVNNNEIFGNDLYGIELAYANTKYNTLWNNNFSDNATSAPDGGSAYEHNLDSNSNDWNFGEQGNFWDDFESNPGYPDYYKISGNGYGIDWHPNKEVFECGMWGDVTGDGQVNPVDVVYMVNYVYKQLDARVQPPNCPFQAGDVDCNDNVNPVDVVYMVNFVYKQLYGFSDPCEGLPNCNVEFPV